MTQPPSIDPYISNPLLFSSAPQQLTQDQTVLILICIFAMRNHLQQQQDQEAMVPMDFQENPNLETTHNDHQHHHHHHHVMVPVEYSKKKLNLETTHNHHHHHHHFMVPVEYSMKKSNLETTHNHHHVMAQMGCQKNPTLETTHNHHVMVPVEYSKKKSNLETTLNHHHVMAKMGCEENLNLEATSNHQQVPPSSLSSSSQEFKKTHCHDMTHVVKKTNVDEGMIKKPNYNVSCSSTLSAGGDMTPPPLPSQQERVEESGRERLKRHRVEMAGRVWIPDIWGHEDLLKDWIDCTVFDSSLGNNSIISARAALVQEGRSTLRIENRC